MFYSFFSGERNIADYFQKYIDALGNSGPFYRRPLQGVRYGEQNVGVNKLKGMMKAICQRGGLRGNFSNHSGKRTCATQLYNAGIEEQEIMGRTGHRSEKGVRKYKQASVVQQKRVASVLDPPLPQESAGYRPNDTSSINTDIPCKVQRSDKETVTTSMDSATFSNCNISFNF